MMNHPKVGTKNVPLILCLFSLALLFIQAVPALAANQYALVCTSCHGMPPLDSAQRDVATGAFQGNHQTHLAAGASASACVKCHANNAYTIDHPTGVINMAARINNYSAGSAGAARYNKPLFFNQTSLPVLATCSNVNCHFETKTLAWSSVMPQTPADCNFCHSFPPNVGVSGTSHATHYANVAAWGGLFGPLTCTPCHSDGGVTGQPKWTYDHATSASRRPIHFDSALGYNGSANKFLPSQAATRVLGSCATTYCHSNGVQGAGNVKVATPVWGVKTTCGSCHASPMATNAHPRHIASFGCELCHSATATNSTTVNVAGGKHTNGVVDMAFSGAAVGTVWTATTVTCSSSYCHSNGATPPVYQPVAWTGAGTLNCASCHPTLSGAHAAHIGTLLSTVRFYNYTANKSTGSELATGSYMFGCANCHPTDPALHANGVVNVLLTPSAAGGTLKAKNSATAAVTVITAGSNVTCFGVYCHSDGKATPTFAVAPNWYGGAITGDKCASCHGNSPTSGAHTAHAVGIHTSDIYSGTTGELAASGAVGVSAGHGDPAQSTTLSCNICHNTTISVGYNDKNAACSSCHNGSTAALKGNAAITNRALHVNGKADLSFYSAAAVKSKAQLRAASFSDYTAAGGYWTRTTYKAGAASMDTAKVVLSNSMYSAGNCSNIACHNGKSVSWTTDVGKGKDCTICHSKL